MARYFFILILFLSSTHSFAQLKNAKVIVYGDNELAWAAAVQSARSGVNTLWLKKEKEIGKHLSENSNTLISGNEGLDAGLWAEFLSRNRGSGKPADSLSIAAKQGINPRIAKNVFNEISDSLKNLTILYDNDIRSLKKRKKDWRVELSNSEKLKINAIVDASDDQYVLNKINPRDLSQKDSTRSSISVDKLYQNTLYRTGLFTFQGKEATLQVPATLLFNTPAENIFVSQLIPLLNKESLNTTNDLPLTIQMGQALGASAAYCAFFETTTSKINIRTLQGELLAFHGQIIPFQDVDIQDPNFAAIQRIGATGILKGTIVTNDSAETFEFRPDDPVDAEEIKPVLLNLYTRSQIWFRDNKHQELTLADVLSLIKFTALRGDELDREVEKGWLQQFHFKGEFNPEQEINRAQFAVLLDYYLKPFNVRIDETGTFRY